MLNPFELLTKLPKPAEVFDALLTAPQVLRDKESLAQHVGYRMAQVVALAVRQTAQSADGQNAWVADSAAAYAGKVIDVVVPIFGVAHTLRWQVAAGGVLQAMRIEPEPDARTITASPANVVLTVQPSVYEMLQQFPPETPDMAVVMEHVHIAGESGLAKWVSRLAEELRPDVWAQLAQLVGATPAGWMQTGFARAKNNAQAFAQSVQARLLDGDSDRAPIGVRHAQLDTLAQSIQSTRGAVDALEQRIKHLLQITSAKARP